MRTRARDSGFSLIELVLVIGLTFIGGAIAIVQLRGTRGAIETQIVSNQVVDQMTYAQQVAINERRNVSIQFLAPNHITVTRLESDGTSTVISDVYLPSGFAFALPGGSPPDTPEGFGNTTAVAFNGATGGTFLGDGTFIDASGVVQNGTVFTIGGGAGSARAVTLTGATGRISQYQLINNVWESTNH